MGIFDRIADQLGDLIVPDDVRMHVELGAASLDRGDLDLAVRELRRAVEKRPDHARAAYLLGLALARKNDLAGAESAFNQAILARPDFAEAYLAQGETRRRAGQIEPAAESFRKALENGIGGDAQRGEAYRGLGAAYLILGRLDKAVRELRKAAAQLPDDVEAQGLLGRALLARGDLDAARLCLEKATANAQPSEATGAVLCALGHLYRKAGRTVDAEAAYVRALAIGGGAQVVQKGISDEGRGGWRIEARLGLAQARLDAGDAAGAHGHALRALEAAPELADVHLTVGRALAMGRSYEAALGYLDYALTLLSRDAGAATAGLELRGPDAEARILDEALHVALRAGLDARAFTYGERILADAANNNAPAPPDALAAVALGRLTDGDANAAQMTIDRAGRETVEVRVAQARIQMAQSQPVAAAAALRRAIELAPDDARPRKLLGEVYRAGRGELPNELYALLRAAHRLLLATPELGDLAPEAARLIDLLDRPLLVTVMGEFNSGKSTFVNALVGEEVAPMGITPTTATINVLKYGAERGGRVVYRDDTTRDIPWDEVPGLLRGLDEEEARKIRVVEVLYPLETLQRVNVVDTPGLNSILPEHEETAREFLGQADAILWLFSVGQAGKATEREALERVRAEKKKALGVVNKIDRTDGDGLTEILTHLQANFGDLVEALVPFSAREALLGKSDPARLAKSNRAELDKVLEERFFAKSKMIKREAAVRRLRALADEAQRRGEAALAASRREAIDAALAAVRADQVIFQRRFLAEERLRLVADLDALYAAGAREVLDFVRPRRWAFGSHQAQPADRDFLLGLVEEKLAALEDASRARVAAEVGRAFAALHPLDGEEAPKEPLRILDEQVYGRHRAFVRGYLRGGRVDDFFTRVLPKIDLVEAGLRKALEREMPNVEILDGELLAPLKSWSERLFDDLVTRLRRLADADELRRFDLEERLLSPVAALRGAIDRIAVG